MSGAFPMFRCSRAAARRSPLPPSQPRPAPSSRAASPRPRSRAPWSSPNFRASSRITPPPPPTPGTPASTAWRSTAPTAICSTSSRRMARNQRTDAYGGSIENRCRLMLEVVDAITKVLPRRAGRHPPVAGEPRPMTRSDSNPQPLFEYLVRELSRRAARLYPRHRGLDPGPARQCPLRLRRPAQGFRRRLYRQ